MSCGTLSRLFVGFLIPCPHILACETNKSTSTSVPHVFHNPIYGMSSMQSAVNRDITNYLQEQTKTFLFDTYMSHCMLRLVWTCVI